MDKLFVAVVNIRHKATGITREMFLPMMYDFADETAAIVHYAARHDEIVEAVESAGDLEFLSLRVVRYIVDDTVTTF